MSIDPSFAFAGLLVGFVVGMTGMGGGALMTPILVLVFHVPALAAVSSDLVTSLIMKPFGGAIHFARGTVRLDIMKWLALGAVPSAFLGVFLLRAIGSDHVQTFLQRAIGVALLTSAAAIVVRAQIQARQAHIPRDMSSPVQRGRTVLIGVIGGLLVGLTSVGSGSVIIVLLMLAYPALGSAELVGTDIVQAIPLVGAAALGHLLLGDVRLALTASLLVGAIPGVIVGANFSSQASSRFVRPILFVVLLATGLKLVTA